GTRLDGQGVANACNGDTIRFRNNIYAGNLTLADTANMGGNGFNAINWLTTPSFSNRVYNVNDSLRLTNPWGFENGGNWVPQANSPALTGASFTDPNLLDPFFTPVTYVGAFGLVNWTIGWAEFNPLNYVIGIQQISSEVPASFSLSQNYPNPFNPNTNIKFSIPRAGFVTLKIYNSLGEEVKTLVSQDLNIGTYKVDFNALNLSSGIYFYRIRVKAEHNFEWAESRKMMLVK
ncbi:MAG TPA: T9SS type A sorting domain-containing protein, partial [Ignavibacteria bacterium]